LSLPRPLLNDIVLSDESGPDVTINSAQEIMDARLGVKARQLLQEQRNVVFHFIADF
jgi:hypothetical protein